MLCPLIQGSHIKGESFEIPHQNHKRAIKEVGKKVDKTLTRFMNIKNLKLNYLELIKIT